MKTEYSLIIWMYILCLNVPISEVSSERLSLAKYRPIKNGWTRSDEGEEGQGGDVKKFEFDFAHYKHCKLPSHKPFFVKKYYIRNGDEYFLESKTKKRVDDNFIVYIAGLNKDILKTNKPPEKAMKGHRIAIRYCGGENWNLIMTSNAKDVGEEGDNQPAFGCGMSTFLSYLCYRDKESDPLINGNSGIGYDFATEIQSEDLIKKEIFEKIKLWAKKVCKWTLKVFDVLPEPRAAGKAYMYAAMDAGYDIFYVFDKDNRNGYISYGIKEVVQEFQNPEWMDKFVKDRLGKENDWFFCKKKI